MKIALIGASGQAGSRILNELASRGHSVTAIARHPEKIALMPGVTRVKGDAGDPAELAAILKGHDAAISSVRFVANDHATLTEAVRRSGVARYLVVGGAGSLLSETGQLILESPNFPEGARPEATKGLAFLTALRGEKDINWTFLSPAMRFIAGERTGKFRLGGDRMIRMANGESWISFEDYAIALVDELETPAHERRRFTVGY
jgi:putative NADH-flavin reductase